MSTRPGYLRPRDRAIGLWLALGGVGLAAAAAYVPLDWTVIATWHRPWLTTLLAVYAVAVSVGASALRLHRCGLRRNLSSYRVSGYEWVLTGFAAFAGVLFGWTEHLSAGGLILVVVACGVTSWFGFYVSAVGMQLAGSADADLRASGVEPGWPPASRGRE